MAVKLPAGPHSLGKRISAIISKKIIFVALVGLLAFCAVGAPVATVWQANAQFGGGGGGFGQPIQTFSGSYSNADAKLQITFPSNWIGSVFQGRTASALTIRAVPNGTQAGQGFGAPDSMTLRIITKNATSGNTNSSLTAFGGFGQGRNFQNRGNMTCTPSTPQTQTINGMSGVMITTQCTSQNFSFQSKSYYFQTADRAFTLSFMARSASDYNNYVTAFDNTAKTLQIANTIEAPSIVVPEFPVAIVGVVLAAAIGGTSLMLRNRSLKPV